MIAPPKIYTDEELQGYEQFYKNWPWSNMRRAKNASILMAVPAPLFLV